MSTDWVIVLQNSFQSLWLELMAFLPLLVLALLIVIVGWILGEVFKRVVERLFATLKVNQLLDAAGADKLTARAGYKLNAGFFVGVLIKWFVIIVFFVAALDVLNLDQVTVFFRDVVLGYLPQVIVAVLILFVAMILANVVHKSVEAGARAAEFSAPKLLGNFARYAILVFAVLAALSQLEIAPNLVEMLFAGFVFAAALALGLAFGLGGRDAASRYVDSAMRKRNSHDERM